MQTPHQPPTGSEERSPLEYFHGLYLADATGFGGATAFSWFADEAEALTYLRQGLVQLYLDASDEADDWRAVSQAVGAALLGTESLKAINHEALNTALHGLCELRWAGSLDDLRVGERPFERGIQRDFNQNVFGDERGLTESDWDDFVHHLTNYNG